MLLDVYKLSAIQKYCIVYVSPNFYTEVAQKREIPREGLGTMKGLGKRPKLEKGLTSLEEQGKGLGRD